MLAFGLGIAVRGEFVQLKASAYQALDEATLDASGKQAIKTYMDSFFDAIGSDDHFYRPVVVDAKFTALRTSNCAPLCSPKPAGV